MVYCWVVEVTEPVKVYDRLVEVFSGCVGVLQKFNARLHMFNVVSGFRGVCAVTEVSVGCGVLVCVYVRVSEFVVLARVFAFISTCVSVCDCVCVCVCDMSKGKCFAAWETISTPTPTTEMIQISV